MFGLVGNREAQKALSQMITSNRIPSTLLFHGQEGVGKTTFAKAFAEKLLGSLPHPDLLEIEPDGKWHSMQTIHEMIAQVSLPPFSASHRIFIIHEAHRMLPVHTNALLKTLEQPPSYCIFILITSELKEVIATIRSRAIEIPFFPIPSSEITSRINHRYKDQIAHLSAGSYGKALLLSHLEEALYENIITMIKAALLKKYHTFFQAVDLITKNQELPVKDLFAFIAYWFRDLHLIKNEIDFPIFFAQERESLEILAKQKTPSPEQIEERVMNALDGYQLNLRLKQCIESIFFQ